MSSLEYVLDTTREAEALEVTIEEEVHQPRFLARYFRPDDPEKQCFRCGLYGHLSERCDTQKSKEAQLKCCLCGSSNHFMSRCPSDRCQNCWKPGHQRRSCRAPPVGTCNICRRVGHLATDCGEAPANRMADFRCHSCRKAGHLDCTSLGLPTRSCCNCGGEHYQEDCAQAPFADMEGLVTSWRKINTDKVNDLRALERESLENTSDQLPTDRNADCATPRASENLRGYRRKGPFTWRYFRQRTPHPANGAWVHDRFEETWEELPKHIPSSPYYPNSSARKPDSAPQYRDCHYDVDRSRDRDYDRRSYVNDRDEHRSDRGRIGCSLRSTSPEHRRDHRGYHHGSRYPRDNGTTHRCRTYHPEYDDRYDHGYYRSRSPSRNSHSRAQVLNRESDQRLRNDFERFEGGYTRTRDYHVGSDFRSIDYRDERERECFDGSIRREVEISGPRVRNLRADDYRDDEYDRTRREHSPRSWAENRWYDRSHSYRRY
eukprot:Rmarinus@m.8369